MGKYVKGSQVGQRVIGTGDVKPDKKFEYDFIIVGGGTAGCVLAARLTENPAFKVLVLESGGSGKSLLFSRIPPAFNFLFHTKHVYELYTTPQAGAAKRQWYWPRGKMLGGCSSINAQMAQYGAPGDFNEWAQITGDDSWSWANFHRYFRKFEKYVPNPKYPDIDGKLKGTTGPVEIGYHNSITKPSEAFVKSCEEVGIPFNPDFNTTAGTKGVSRTMTYINNKATRVSSETAYLTRDVLARPNLIVATHSSVTKILFDKPTEGKPRAIGVQFAASQTAPTYQAFARKEVLLTAGAVHSPHVLLLSGIGAASQLEKHKIPVVHDLPGVGENLVDHPVVDLALKDKLNASTKHIKPKTPGDAVKALGSVYSYFVNHKGPMATNLGEAAAFCRSDDPTLFPPSEFTTPIAKDSTSAEDSPDLELFATPFAYKDHGGYIYPQHTVGLHAVLLRPNSKGTLTLKSKSPWVDPVMDPNYFEAPEDVEKLVRGLRLLFKISKAGPLASRIDHKYQKPRLDHALERESDEKLREIVRERSETLYHPAGSCRMAPLTDGGVVDSQLKVHGIKGLRVCDASIFPKIVSGHTAGAVFAIAEKTADVIKNEYPTKKE